MSKSPEPAFSRQRLLENCILHTEVSGFAPPYRGKVRDVYTVNDATLAIVVTDRISAFDHILKQPIPFKGQILNRTAAFTFSQVSDLTPVHMIDVPHPNVMIARKCTPLPIEVVVRGYLTGHAWRTYQSGKRVLCGVHLPDDMVQHQKFEKPVITPTTKATEGHDQDISREDIIRKGIIKEDLWAQIEETSLNLFRRGTEIAGKNGLLLVDTKYEFGLFDGELTLIDEIHTPDSSRYFYADGYEERLTGNKPQRQLSKEFIREWLIEKNFMGKDGQEIPDMSDEYRISVFERYAELYERLTGSLFIPEPVTDFNEKLKEILLRFS